MIICALLSCLIYQESMGSFWFWTYFWTLEVGFLYRTSNHSINVSSNPILLKTCSRNSQSTLSNAFSASRPRSIDGWDCDRAVDIILSMCLMLFIPSLPGIKPVWSGLINLLMIFWSLLAIIALNIFALSLPNKLIGIYEAQCVGSFPSLCMTEMTASPHVLGGSLAFSA